MTDWQDSLRTLLNNWPRDIGPWVAASITLYILGVWLYWLLPRHWQDAPFLSSRRWDTARWLLSLAYMTGLPYLALIAGKASPRLMGLSENDWIRSLGPGGAMALAALALFALAWWSYRSVAPVPQAERRSLGPLSLLHAIALQIHWAFYRNATLLWFDDTYWGVWASLALVSLEASCNPDLWSSLRIPARLETIVHNVALLVVTTTLFYYTHNLWLGFAFHVLAEFITARWRVGGQRHDRHIPVRQIAYRPRGTVADATRHRRPGQEPPT